MQRSSKGAEEEEDMEKERSVKRNFSMEKKQERNVRRNGLGSKLLRKDSGEVVSIGDLGLWLKRTNHVGQVLAFHDSEREATGGGKPRKVAFELLLIEGKRGRRLKLFSQKGLQSDEPPPLAKMRRGSGGIEILCAIP
jgi:hypothetical protein